MNLSAYEFQLENYSGPLDKLLELIEAEKLDVTALSLAQVTDAFLKYLETLREQSDRAKTEEEAVAILRLLADFIVIASRLVFIKSKALLPDIKLSDEEEADIHELEERLRVLRELKPAIKELATTWNAGRHSWSRPYFLNTVSPTEQASGVQIFYPSPKLTRDALELSLRNMFSAFRKFVMETETIREKVVSLEAKIKEIIGRVREIAETSFSKLTTSSTRGEMVLAFLAILHLAREQMVSLEQDSHFSDILIRNNPDGAAPADLAADPPQDAEL